MKLRMVVGPRTGERLIYAERTVDGVTYRGLAYSAEREGGVREAVLNAVESLNAKHGKQLPLKVGQVKRGGES